MKVTDTSEKGLESLIVESLVCDARYEPGRPEDYDRDHAVDFAKLLAFLRATQPDALAALGIEAEGPKRAQFLSRLQGEIAKRGVIDVLRTGVRHGPISVDLFYGKPSPGNAKAAERFAANIFSVTRQLRYSKDETQLALDLGIFINGLPIRPVRCNCVGVHLIELVRKPGVLRVTDETNHVSMPFGHVLRARRLAKKLGLRKFAELVGVSPTYLSQVEQCNVMPPTADRVKRMAELLGENSDEWIALAGRVPDDVSEIISKQPTEMPKLLRDASGLTLEQLRQLREQIRRLKEQGDE